MNDFTQQLVAQLVPQAPGLQVAQVITLPDQLILHLVSTQVEARCPTCQTLSSRVHSHYRRTLADLPWGPYKVQLLLRVRKFFCEQPLCPRRTFAERLPSVMQPYARRTTRQTASLQTVGLALGGQAGARLARQLHMPTSRPTLLRLVQRLPAPVFPRPEVIGVDDWAYRRGHRYGTIIVDLQRRRPIELLPDRQPATLTAWLRQQPQIRVICRDRAGGYAQAAREGAPQATQVADRWHLIKNLVAALEKFLLNKRTVLKQAAQNPAPAEAPQSLEEEAPPRPGAQRQEAARQQRHARIVEYYERVHELAAKHVDPAEIARQVGISRPTVYRYLRMSSPPSPKRPLRRRSRLLAPYEAYLLRRWNEGCRNALQLYREIKAQSYAYSAHTVERFIGALRRAHGQPRSFRRVAANEGRGA